MDVSDSLNMEAFQNNSQYMELLAEPRKVQCTYMYMYMHIQIITKLSKNLSNIQ